MTEVELSRLLSELSTTAATLNRESDSINAIIEGLEERLRALNVGLEVWVDDDPLESEATEGEGRNGERYETGTIDGELGFTKLGGVWRLAVRTATYKYDDPDHAPGYQNPRFKSATGAIELSECPRKLRIEALERFPKLVAAMKMAAEAAVKAIEAAKKFTK